MDYIEPKHYLEAFTCPHCNSITQQKWIHFKWDGNRIAKDRSAEKGFGVTECTHCKKHTLWDDGRLVSPSIDFTIPPNAQMPESVLKLYKEAASINSKSPRGAAALLRLGVQILCKEVGGKGKNINDDIRFLVQKGLPEIVQKSLDVVRVTGNDAVHPGQIDTDSPEVVASLFRLLNVIVEYMIALPNEVSGLFDALPESSRDSIEKRDTPKT